MSQQGSSTDGHLSASQDAHVNINRIDLSDRTMSAVALAVALASLMGTAWAIHEAGKSALETRLLEQQAMDMQALLVREGLRIPTDHSNGPAGNIQYKRKEP